MNFTVIEKSSHTWQKFSNDYDMIQLQNQQSTNNTLHERKCSTELLVFSKGVLKNFANFIGKHSCRVKCEPKMYWFIHEVCTFIIKETPAHSSCFSVSSAEFLRIPILEHPWASASDFIFDIFNSSKYMKVSFLLTVFYRKSKIKQKS